MLKKIRQWWMSMRYYVIMDPKDNSVTLNKHLFNHIKKHSQTNETKVFVFNIPAKNAYGFMVNPDIKDTQLSNIQYNDKYHCIGFETLCPSVGKIFFDYGLPALHVVKLSVSISQTNSGQIYYIIEKPVKKIK